MMPSLAVFGLYAASGLQGNSKTQISGGVGRAWARSFGATYPETAVGLSFGASIRNRSAQADNIRSQLERNQMEISLQNTRNQIRLQVQQSRIGLIQGKAQVEAAREATRLALESRDAEQEKLREGLSTAYNVILKERDLVTAQYAEVQVDAAYANSLVGMDQATGNDPRAERNPAGGRDQRNRQRRSLRLRSMRRPRMPAQATPAQRAQPMKGSARPRPMIAAPLNWQRGSVMRAPHMPGDVGRIDPGALLRAGPGARSGLQRAGQSIPEFDQALREPLRSGAESFQCGQRSLEVQDGKLRCRMAQVGGGRGAE